MSLNIIDVIFMEQMIRACSARGAIKAEEMLEVGKVYNKLKVLVDQAKEQVEKSKENQEKKLETIEEVKEEVKE